jgi:hypothetical protein
LVVSGVYLNSLKMKYSFNLKYIGAIIFFIVIALSSQAQKIYSVDYKSQADVKVFVVKYESECDLKVYKVEYKSEAKENKGLWFFVKYTSEADKKIYFVEYKSEADLKIFFVKYKSQVGWKENSKKYLMY